MATMLKRIGKKIWGVVCLIMNIIWMVTIVPIVMIGAVLVLFGLDIYGRTLHDFPDDVTCLLNSAYGNVPEFFKEIVDEYILA